MVTPRRPSASWRKVANSVFCSGLVVMDSSVVETKNLDG